MADLGLTKAIGRAVRKGATRASVKRAGQETLEESLEQAPKAIDAPVTKTQAPSPTEPITPKVEEPKVVETPEITPTRVDEPPPATLNPEQPTATPTKPSFAEETPVIRETTEQEARRISEQRLEDFSLDETFQTNFDTINTTDDIKAVIADVSEKNAGRIDESRRGKITNEQLQGLAEDLDINDDVVRQVMERESGGILNAETILAARQILNSSADRISTLAKKITAGQATDMERLQFRRQLQFHSEYQTQFLGARAEAGRALNAFKIPTGADEINLSRIRELVDVTNGHDTNQVAAAIAMMDNTTAITKAARKYTQSKLMGSINELFINSILSGPKTHLINIGGNILMQFMNIAETAVAARLGRFLSGADHVRIGEAGAMIHGMISGWRDGLRLAAKTMRTGTALDDVVKFESTRRRSISAEHLLTPEQRATPMGHMAEALLDGVRVPVGNKDIPVPGIGPILRAPTERVMAPTDELFKTLAYRSELERQAFRHAYDQVSSGAAKMDEVADIVRDFMENPPKDIQKLAEDYALYVTFQNPLGEAGQRFQLALRSMPVLSILAPFIRTPVNIFKAGILDRSPLALATSKFWNSMKEGGAARDLALARVSMGTATTAIVAAYTIDGTITGGGPSNPQARSLLEAQGWQPYSIKVGDEYHSYARAEPLAFVIGATADAAEIMSYITSDVQGLEDEEEQVSNAIAAIIVGVANNTMSKTYVKGISDFTEMMSDPKRYFDGWARNMVPAFIPYSSFRAQIGQIQDPYMREAWTVLDNIRVKSGIAGYSEAAPVRRDIFGEPRMHRSGSLLGPMSPFPDREEVANPVLDEVVSLMEQTRKVPLTMPSKRVEGMKLDADQYEQLVVIARSRPGPNGRTFKDELSRVMNLPAYAQMTPGARVDVIKDIQRRYDDVGRALLEQEDPVFAAKIAAYRQRRDQFFGE